MALYDFLSVRLHVTAPLSEGAVLGLDKGQHNYLTNVLRLKPGNRILVFNGKDGEFAALLSADGKKQSLLVGERTRPQAPLSSLRWLFAPLKHARLDYMVQKAVEMGVGSIEPVITRRTQVSRINLERMHANAVEASEQCGILTIPQIIPERPLATALAQLDDAHLVFCDEDAPVRSPFAALDNLPDKPIAVLIGPEGGFDETERAAITRLPSHTRLSLGPRILRADTAAVAALALVQARKGDWLNA